MEWVVENWALIVGAGPAGLTALWALAQLTPFDWDNKIVSAAREAWSKVPIGEMDPRKMGK